MASLKDREDTTLTSDTTFRLCPVTSNIVTYLSICDPTSLLTLYQCVQARRQRTGTITGDCGPTAPTQRWLNPNTKHTLTCPLNTDTHACALTHTTGLHPLPQQHGHTSVGARFALTQRKQSPDPFA